MPFTPMARKLNYNNCNVRIFKLCFLKERLARKRRCYLTETRLHYKKVYKVSLFRKKKYVLLLSRICNTRVPGDYYEPDTTLTMSKIIDKDCFLNFKAIIPCTFIQNCVVP